MASLTTRSDGTRRLQFHTHDRRRITLYLGDMDRRAAEMFRMRVEEILAAKAAAMPLTTETARWLGDIAPRYYDKLAQCGLVPDKKTSAGTLKQLLDQFFATLPVKPSTLVTYQQTRRTLEEYFKPSTPVRSIMPLEADRWRQYLKDQGLAQATIARRVKSARQIFKAGIKWRMVNENPFADVRAGSQVNEARREFIPLETYRRVLDACPDQEWRVLFALSRIGGLRCPSEHIKLRWRDVNFATGRITVWSPKTEGQGKPYRVVPMFPELRVELEALYELAEPGDEFVVTRYRHSAVNLRTAALRFMARAGVPAWPKVFHNLRASRQTELAAKYPLADVCQWLGNTPTVAAQHYLMPQDQSFDHAARTPMDAAAEPSGSGPLHSRSPSRATQTTTRQASDLRRIETQSQMGEVA